MLPLCFAFSLFFPSFLRLDHALLAVHTYLQGFPRVVFVSVGSEWLMKLAIAA